MIKANIKIEGVKKSFEIPQSWEELNTGSFLRLTDVYRHEEEPKPSQIIAAILGLPHSDVLMIDAQSLDDNVFYNLMFLQSASGWSAIIDAMPKQKFKVGNQVYKILRDFGSITLGQKEAAIQAINSQQPFSDKAFELLHVFYKDMNKKDFDNSSAMEVYPVVNFFLKVWYVMNNISTQRLHRKQQLSMN